MDLANLSVAELKELQLRIPREIDRRSREEKAQLRKELEVLAAKYGYGLEELIKDSGKPERTPVAVKYRHPTAPELAWTGRGRQPKWVASFLEEGGSLEQLAV